MDVARCVMGRVEGTQTSVLSEDVLEMVSLPAAAAAAAAAAVAAAAAAAAATFAGDGRHS
jgi:hypothetical protein